MQERISKVAHEYAGRQLKVGDAFDIEPDHVPLLLALGRIEPAECELGYVARDMSAGAPAEYRTRDMNAETPCVKRGYKRKAA